MNIKQTILLTAGATLFHDREAQRGEQIREEDNFDDLCFV